MYYTGIRRKQYTIAQKHQYKVMSMPPRTEIEIALLATSHSEALFKAQEQFDGFVFFNNDSNF